MAQDPNAPAFIEVKDQGLRILEADVPRIFVKFFRVDQPAGSIKDVGLDVHLAKKILNLHEGGIDVRSDVGEFASVVTLLPVDALVRRTNAVLRMAHR
ncbi:ATP-binding protein [Noviherbaspirillum galbum]|uniref:histidine kinase n=1 Tax=Noviherbaspirillum galbum TaxID=2709383 RepID=A0A6B3SLQ9_9BURK|nr:ATP-binding protein [Noviherbaspirillum galbum]NEX59576.1 ATP-binding protein [Noviherbaspirillum galbum]